MTVVKLALILALIVAFNVWDWIEDLEYELELDICDSARTRDGITWTCCLTRGAHLAHGYDQHVDPVCGPWSLRLGECYDLRPPRSVWGYR
jgi:hypothetical protein